VLFAKNVSSIDQGCPLLSQPSCTSKSRLVTLGKLRVPVGLALSLFSTLKALKNISLVRYFAYPSRTFHELLPQGVGPRSRTHRTANGPQCSRCGRLGRRVKILQHRQRPKRNNAHGTICTAIDQPAVRTTRLEFYRTSRDAEKFSLNVRAIALQRQVAGVRVPAAVERSRLGSEAQPSGLTRPRSGVYGNFTLLKPQVFVSASAS
jgi:hypothetical protein